MKANLILRQAMLLHVPGKCYQNCPHVINHYLVVGICCIETLEAGIYRVNKVKNETGLLVDCSSLDEKELPQTFVDYEEWGRVR
jgi:hypothetical protein